MLLDSVDLVPPLLLFLRDHSLSSLGCLLPQVLAYLRFETAVLELLFDEFLFGPLKLVVPFLLPEESPVHHTALDVVMDVVGLDLGFEGALSDLLFQLLLEMLGDLTLVSELSLSFESVESLPSLLLSPMFVLLIELN